MSSGSVKNPFTGEEADDDLKLDQLIQAIANSALSEGKKMAYLYLIAAGTFSMDHMEGLNKDMEEAGRRLEKRITYREKKIAGYDEKLAKLEKEIAELTPLATKEVQENLDKFVAAVSRETEAEQSKSKEKQISHLKTKIHKP